MEKDTDLKKAAEKETQKTGSKKVMEPKLKTSAQKEREKIEKQEREEKVDVKHEVDVSDFSLKDISHVDYDNQTNFFVAVRTIFDKLNMQQGLIPYDDYAEAYVEAITQVLEMAVEGNVPAQDFLCYIYKKGVPDVLPIDLTRAHQWGIIAISNGSLLSIERLRLFLSPVYDFIINSGKIDAIVDNNHLPEDGIAAFVVYNFAGLLVDEMKLTLQEMAKKPITTDERFEVFMHHAEEARAKVLPKLLEYIA